MARRAKLNSSNADPQTHLCGEELFRQMSELISLREKVAQAELAATHYRSLAASNRHWPCEDKPGQRGVTRGNRPKTLPLVIDESARNPDMTASSSGASMSGF
jgi:hypothetical protein